MRRITRTSLLFVVAALFLAGCGNRLSPLPESDRRPSFGGESGATYVPGEVIAVLLPGASAREVAARVGGEIVREIPQIHTVVIKLPQGGSVEQAVTTLNAMTSHVKPRGADPNYLYYMQTTTPNDPLFVRQWAHTNTRAADGWSIHRGSAGVIIAITDTGVDGTHPDLSGKVTAGFDTWHMRPIAPNTNSDVHGHGTHVAGIAAAHTNNAEGIAGVCWFCLIMPLKISMDVPPFTATCASMAAAFVWAADNGARVVNTSFGSRFYCQAMKDAVNYAAARDVLIFASMGNTGRDEIFYPAGYQAVAAVGATDSRDRPARFTTTSRAMSVQAPGVDILSAVLGHRYEEWSGTSMSSPFAAGLAGLIRSQRTDWTAKQVRSQIEATADDLGAPGFDPVFGHGRVNVARALGAAAANVYGRLGVTVRDPGGAPVVGAEVIVWQDGVPVTTTRTTTGGVALFHFIRAGTYRVTASHVLAGVTRTGAVDGVVVRVGVTTEVAFIISP